MGRSTFLIALAAIVSLAVPGSAPAQDSPQVLSTVAQPPHERLLESILGPFDMASLSDRVLAEMKTALLEGDGSILTLEKQSPGTVKQIVEAMRPIIERSSETMLVEHKREALAILRSGLSDGEAGEAADFYSSPLGLKLMKAMADNVSFQQTIRTAVEADDAKREAASASAMRSDIANTAERAIAELTPTERTMIGLQLLGAPWLAKLKAIQPKIDELNMRMFNQPFSPEEEQALSEAVESVIAKRTPMPK